MLTGATTGRRFVYGTVLAAMLPFGSQVADAHGLAHHRWQYAFHYSGLHPFSRAGLHPFWRAGWHARIARYYGGWGHHHSYAHYYGYGHYYGIQCVAFVRAETGVQISGNAGGWWNAAEGLYDRGHKPESGAVLVFRGAGRMRLGHVAVVRNVVSPREIDIDHAHWAGAGIYRGVSVIDVSSNNDWTAVRVAIRPGAKYGSVYPTYGFIYDHTPGPRIETANATDATPARLQTAKATDSMPAQVQTASAVDYSQPSEELDEPAPSVRSHWRRHWHWHRLVARRHVIAEVAEQPAHHWR
jgi:hypothetical protein